MLRHCLGIALGVSVLAAGGCTWMPESQFSAVQARFRRLSEQTDSQQSEIANLNAHRRSVEDQLIAAERELAALDKQNKANVQRLAVYEQERQALYRKLSGTGGRLPAGVSDQLAALARRYPFLNYDPQTGVGKLDTDVLFNTAEAQLLPDAKEMLTQFAGILRSPDAKGLRLMVVGHTDNERIKGPDVREEYPNNWHLSAGRALAVADFLRVCGVSETQMGVAGFGQYQPVAANNSGPERQKNRRVELFLVAPDVPVVGWTETLSTVYR
ncbi:MAG: OmpA family protein [Planctomycetia bacterium]|nr:OmpA family protein [Planctomycetia bacterium]